MSQKIYLVLVLDIIHLKLRHILSDLWYLMFSRCKFGTPKIKIQTKY